MSRIQHLIFGAGLLATVPAQLTAQANQIAHWPFDAPFDDGSIIT